MTKVEGGRSSVEGQQAILALDSGLVAFDFGLAAAADDDRVFEVLVL